MGAVPELFRFEMAFVANGDSVLFDVATCGHPFSANDMMSVEIDEIVCLVELLVTVAALSILAYFAAASAPVAVPAEDGGTESDTNCLFTAFCHESAAEKPIAKKQMLVPRAM